MKSRLAMKTSTLALLASLAAAPAAAQTTSPGSSPTLEVGGYLQAQYEDHQTSEDQLGPSGERLNLDRFLIRRARLRMDARSEWASARLELNGSTSGGSTSAEIYRAEARLHYRPEGSERPLGEFTLGLTRIPFGYELVQSSSERLFMERALVVRSLFPGTNDIGAVLSGNYEWFNLSVALMNGEPNSSLVPFGGSDPNGAKDLLVRVGADSGPTTIEAPLRVSGNVSVLTGEGFSPGQPATKARIEWTDINEDGAIQGFEQNPIPGRAAVASRNFDRWAVGADLQLEYRSSLGATKLMGEIILGQYLDRYLFVTDPARTEMDTRQLGWYAAITQEIGENLSLGFRYDSYDPDSNAMDTRRGSVVPTKMTVTTLSPVIALELPDVARLSFQYDFVLDHMARDQRGIPTDLANDAWTLRLQVKM